MTLRHIVLSLLIGLASFLLWAYAFPQGPNYMEQYQLFMLDWNYLIEKLNLPGGLVDFLSEFIASFFYPSSILAGLLMAFISIGLYLSSRSIITPLLCLLLMGDCDIMLSFPIALSIACAFCPLLEKGGFRTLWTIPLLYWAIGPLCIIPLVHSLIHSHSRKDILCAVFALTIIVFISAFFAGQYPPIHYLYGLNYHRFNPSPSALRIIICCFASLSCLIMPALREFKARNLISILGSLCLIVASYFSIPSFFDKNMWTQLGFDYQIRHENWTEVISRANIYQPKTALSASCVNLALIMNGQIDQMHKYYQCGPEGLLCPRVRDQISDMATAEAFFRIGLVNSAMRYYFDMQEASGIQSKSGRCTKRITECCIVNGWYELAYKYIIQLEKSPRYRSWAKEAKKYLYNDSMVLSHPVYSYLRAVRFEDDFLYSYSELDKMLARLYSQNKSNLLAAYYFQAYSRLQK